MVTYQLLPLETLELVKPDVERRPGLRPQHVRHQPGRPKSRRQLLLDRNLLFELASYQYHEYHVLSCHVT